MTREGPAAGPGGCVLHLQTGEVRIPATECASLQCEPGVTSALGSARPLPVLALLVLYVLGSLAWAARWRALLELADIDLPLTQVWRLSVEAQAGGILLPGGLGGDALRITSLLSKRTRSGGKAPATLVVASVLLDRFVGLGTVAALAAALGFAFGGVQQAGPLAYALAGIPVALLAGLAVMRLAPIHRIDWLVQGRLGQLVKPVLDYLRAPRALQSIAVAVALSILVAGVQFGVIRGLVVRARGRPRRPRSGSTSAPPWPSSWRRCQLFRAAGGRRMPPTSSSSGSRGWPRRRRWPCASCTASSGIFWASREPCST